VAQQAFQPLMLLEVLVLQALLEEPGALVEELWVTLLPQITVVVSTGAALQA
jgi:uncharacterized membrane protein YhfC